MEQTVHISDMIDTVHIPRKLARAGVKRTLLREEPAEIASNGADSFRAWPFDGRWVILASVRGEQAVEVHDGATAEAAIVSCMEGIEWPVPLWAVYAEFGLDPVRYGALTEASAQDAGPCRLWRVPRYQPSHSNPPRPTLDETVYETYEDALAVKTAHDDEPPIRLSYGQIGRDDLVIVRDPDA